MEQFLERRDDRYKYNGQNFSIDRGRIIQSQAFRRLQGKTQVVGTREHDFFRNRLTHSMEVGLIGCRILARLNGLVEIADSNGLAQQWLPDRDLIEAACLAHDIGHPAFGHNGEVALHHYMKDVGGFEGNGQTLRMLSKLGEFSKGCGYNLCRRTMLATVKYPILYSKALIEGPKNKPPKCIHDTEEDVLNFLLEPFSTKDQQNFLMFEETKGYNKSIFKSLDCSIMELADDISYAIHDLEDAITMGLVSKETVAKDLKTELKSLSDLAHSVGLVKGRCLCDWMNNFNGTNQLKAWVTSATETFIRSFTVTKHGVFESDLLDYSVTLNEPAMKILDSIKDYIYGEVIAGPKLQTLEYKGQIIIKGLLDALDSAPDKLLPRNLWQSLSKDEQADKAKVKRLICDYIASMSDIEATNMYQRLYIPDAGSIFEPGY